MLPIRDLETLRAFREDAIKKRARKKASGQIQIIISMNSSSIAAGAKQTLSAILSVVETNEISNIQIKKTGGLGLDASEPIVQVVIGDQPKITYGNVTPDIVNLIFKEHVLGGDPVTANIIPFWN